MKRLLAKENVLSPSDADDFAAIEWLGLWHEGPSLLRVGSVSTGMSTVVHESEDEIAQVRFTADGRGATFLERRQPARLGYASRSGNHVEVLAEWESGLLEGSYITDGSGCVALYSTADPDPGTWLVMIPREVP